MTHVLIKVYAAFFPADETCRAAVETAGQDAMGHEDGPWLFLEGDIVRVGFEGMYFPSEEVLAAFAAHLPKQAQGKMDVLDLDAWTLTRHIWKNGAFQSSPPRNLNHVMDYSGH